MQCYVVLRLEIESWFADKRRELQKRNCNDKQITRFILSALRYTQIWILEYHMQCRTE